MNRLARKFVLGIISILLFTLLLSLLINTKLVERYYLYRQSDQIRAVGDRLESLISEGGKPDDVIASLEQDENVLIVRSDTTENNNLLNNELREKFRAKGLGFQKFWLWEQDYKTAISSGKTMRIYNQDKLNYGILVEYIKNKESLYAIAAIVPNTSEVVTIINSFLIIINLFSLIIATALVIILARHITNPLKQIEEFSRKISCQTYETLSVKTNDELETVADSMNQMSQSIQQYQKILVEKNKQMEQLLDNVAHDLKTPISLVNMYASGIRDGLDDGTFVDTILNQSHRMSLMTEQLLRMSRIGQKNTLAETLDIGVLLLHHIEEQRILAESREIEIRSQIEGVHSVTGNRELISTVFSNLLSNALKYTSGKAVIISLLSQKDGCCFTISNETDNQSLDLKKIWEPFYVGEASRNKALSGTGLGLSIVKKITEQEGYLCTASLSNGIITFEVFF